MGDGTTTPRLTPIQVKDTTDPTGFLTGVISVAAATRHSLALKSNGTVWAWGYNSSGQLGDGTYIGKATPVQVKDPADPSTFLTGVKALAAGDAGYGHSVALKENGTVWTWGTIDFAVLGRIYTGAGSTPPNVAGQVTGLTNVTAIAAGWEHTLALKADGTVWACGRNLEGQLGDNTTQGSTFPPPTAKFFVQVKTDSTTYLTGVARIAADGRHSVAVKTDGSAWGWGSNTGYGQLCDGTTTNRTTAVKMKDPADVTGFLTGVERAGAGDYHTLLIKKDGTAWGCGANFSGQLGIGSQESPKLAPVQARIPQYSLIYAWGSGYITPGEIATFLVEYHNTTTDTLQDAVALFDIPVGFDYVSSSHGGIYRADRNQIFWKLGSLAPGAKGLLTLKIEIPWGLPLHQDIMMFVDLAARNIASSTLVDDYLNYVPVQVVAEVPYTAGDIQALWVAEPKVKQLFDYALSLGYVFDQVAQRYDFSDGASILVLALMNPAQSGPVFLKRSGDRVFLEKFEGTVYSLFDRNGGFSVDSNDGIFKGWGTWAVAHSQTQDRCTVNCLTQNPLWNRYIRTKTFKQTSLCCIACQQALKDKKSDPTNCANCARLYVEVNGGKHPEFARDIGKCIGDCQANSSQWQCQSGEIMRVCDAEMDTHVGPFGFPLPVQFINEYLCKIEGEGSKWVDTDTVLDHHEICNSDEKCVNTPEPHCVKSCNETASSQGTLRAPGLLGDVLCEPHLTPLQVQTSVAHDPNAKSADVRGDVLPGQHLTYTIEYENVGQATAYGVFILDELDPNLDPATLSVHNGGTYAAASRLLGWDIGTLAAQAKGSVSYSVQVQSGTTNGTEITNTAKVYFPSANEITPTNPVAHRVQPLAADPLTVTTTSGTAVPITLSGRDSGARALTYRITRPPDFGTLTGTPPGITYTSMTDFSGPDAFAYAVNNGLTESAPARVLIKVNPGLADANSPVVVATYPKANGTDVHVDPNPIAKSPSIYRPSLWATFSEPLDAATVTTSTFTVSGGLTGSVVYDQTTWTAYFLPGQALSPATTYTAQLTTGIKDKTGKPLAANHIWNFTTESAANIVVLLSDIGTELRFGKISGFLSWGAKVINVLSTGPSNLILGTITQGGADPDDFRVTEDQCSGKTLAQGENCTISVMFQPLSTAPKSAWITIPSNDPDQPSASVVLKGEADFIPVYLPLILR